MSTSRETRETSTESASLIGRIQDEALVQHIMQQIDKIISEKFICLEEIWLLIQKDNIGVAQLYITLNKMLVAYNLTIDKFYTNEAQLQTEIDKSRKTLLYILRTVAEGYKICKDRNSSRFESDMSIEWSRYNQDFDELDFIAEGAFGKVYKARCRLDGAEYAIKKVDVPWSSDLSSVIEEVKIIARLNHPNIVNYKTSWLEPIIESTNKKRMKSTNCTDSSVGFGDSDDDLTFSNREVETIIPKQFKGVTLYIQMDCSQLTLRQWLDRSRSENSIQLHNQSVSPIGKEILIDMFKQLVKGLHYIHSQGITHRDLKADNVLLTPNESGYSVQLCDFGLAYPRQNSHDELSNMHRMDGFLEDMVSLATILLEMLEPCKTDGERVKILRDLQEGNISKQKVIHDPRFEQIIKKLVCEKEGQYFDTTQLLEELNQLSSDYNDQSISARIAHTNVHNEERTH